MKERDKLLEQLAMEGQKVLTLCSLTGRLFRPRSKTCVETLFFFSPSFLPLTGRSIPGDSQRGMHD